MLNLFDLKTTEKTLEIPKLFFFIYYEIILIRERHKLVMSKERNLNFLIICRKNKMIFGTFLGVFENSSTHFKNTFCYFSMNNMIIKTIDITLLYIIFNSFYYFFKFYINKNFWVIYIC